LRHYSHKKENVTPLKFEVILSKKGGKKKVFLKTGVYLHNLYQEE
jgi:hypothetical protein